MGLTYPAPAATISGDVVSINRFLSNPTLVARRLRTLLEQRYIADALLQGRFRAEGGAIMYETGESIFIGEDPKAVAPSAEYPLVNVPSGAASIAKTVKWGQDTLITDESIARRLMDPVNRAFLKLVNQNVKYIDGVALGVIASAVTNTAAAAAVWTTATAAQIFKDVALADANIRDLNQGFDPDTVVVSTLAWANAKAAFVTAGYLPRESANTPVLTGEFQQIDGKRWLVSPNLPTANTALVLDSSQLGGMADEDIGGPGYYSAGGVGIQAKVMREDETDEYRLRCRRVTVPVVLEPGAARTITGLGV